MNVERPFHLALTEKELAERWGQQKECLTQTGVEVQAATETPEETKARIRAKLRHPKNVHSYPTTAPDDKRFYQY